ncbi:hypothetical protein [Corynebacterium gerontici]|uniref:Uncharacterized protein n=1 Tax=Corynebacterium gerontici TaxID=2079234 RepID=A0A3G6J100_9CORY|nr:hypothetical protein [Corynebacterium gerontici]AZA11705.1 hypothetical protein CGERO_07025 [Corynebacterium gerontici]
MGAQGHPIADLNDSLLGWASQSELEFSQRLGGLDIVADLDLASDELERIERLYGIFLSRQLAAGAEIEPLLLISPALTLMTLCNRAFQLVDAPRFAEEYAAGLGIDAQIDLESIVPQLFQKFGLAMPTEDVEKLACLHAGVLANDVPALLEAMDFDEAYPPLVQELQALLPDVAERILHGVAALRDFAVDHPASWYDRDRSALPALPAQVAEALVAELRERPVGTRDRASAVGVANREMRPRILFDTQRNKVCLRLPEQRVPRHADGTFGEVNWRVSIEGTTKVYRTGNPWHTASGFAETLDVAIDHPVREITVQDLSNGITWTVSVLGDDAALLFTTRGANMSDKASLHYETLLVVAPADATVSDVVHGGELEATDTQGLNWEGWTVRTLDLTHASSLAVTQVGHTPRMELVRSVDTRQRVKFLAPEPVSYLHSAGGLRVHESSLIAEFPPTPSGAEEIWQLSISSYAGVGHAGEEVAAPEPLEIPAEGGAFSVFDPDLYDAPWVGEYLVRIRGPRNESFRHEFAIVEGLRAAITMQGVSKQLRIPTAGGLSETSLQIKPGSKPFDVTPRHIIVPTNAASAQCVVSTEEGDQLPLRFTPARLTFELPTVSEPAMWRARRMQLDPTDIAMGGQLRVRTGTAMVDPKVTVRNHHGSPLKTAKLQSEDQLTYQVPLAQLAGQSAKLPAGRVDLEWTDPTGTRISVAIADVAAKNRPSIELLDGVIYCDAEAIWVWPLTAPWEPARAFELDQGKVALPDSYIGAGDLAVQSFALDPFMTLIAPVAPSEQAQRIEQPGFFEGADPSLGELAAFLAGEQEHAPHDSSIMPVLWDMVTTGVAVGESAKAVRAVFSAHPSAALSGLSASLVPAHRQPGRVVESGLVRAKFGLADDLTPHRVPWIGTLELLGALAEGHPARPLLKQLRNLAGENLITALQTARDTTLDSACIDKSTVAIAGMDAAQQEALLEMFFSRSKIVPGLLMDDATRLLAVFETFNHREELKHLLSDEGLIKAAVTLLRTLRSANKQLYAMARVRFDKLDGVDTDAKDNVWSLAPVVSMVLALVARMQAHGMITSNKTLDAATPGWAAMADLVPDLVTGDLISADAVVVALQQPELL